jgi:hypothetical protein
MMFENNECLVTGKMSNEMQDAHVLGGEDSAAPGADDDRSHSKHRSHTGPILGRTRQEKAIQRGITRLLTGVQKLARRLPEGALEFVWIHTKGPGDGHTQLYHCTSPNLEVLSHHTHS